MLIQGFKAKSIAQQLYISERTVTTHQENIYKKLNIHHKACLIRYCPYYFKFLACLTTREKTIISLLTDGYGSQQVAQQLNISIETVSSHRKSINKKLTALREEYDVLGIVETS